MNKKQSEFFDILGGHIKMVRGCYNVTSDAVWLAAFAACKKAKTVLDAGIGTGGVSLCLLHHNSNLQITGIDNSDEMLAECAINTEINFRNMEILNKDIFNWRTARTFDLVVTNPPYFRGMARAGGMHHNADIYQWTRACLRRVRPHGYFAAIIDAAQMDKVIAALYDGNAGAIEIVPLFGMGKTVSAERVLIGAKLGAKSPTIIYAARDINDEKVLRDGLTLEL